MAASWPATLPSSFIRQSYGESLPNNTIRSDYSVGDIRMRRRSVSGPLTIQAGQILGSSQVAALKSWYMSTASTCVNFGSKPFTWNHPQTGSTLYFVFAQPPVIHSIPNSTLFQASYVFLVKTT